MMARQAPLREMPCRAAVLWMSSGSAPSVGKTPRQSNAERKRRKDIFGHQHTGFQGWRCPGITFGCIGVAAGRQHTVGAEVRDEMCSDGAGGGSVPGCGRFATGFPAGE